jgi:hypothetical protein
MQLDCDKDNIANLISQDMDNAQFPGTIHARKTVRFVGPRNQTVQKRSFKLRYHSTLDNVARRLPWSVAMS